MCGSVSAPSVLRAAVTEWRASASSTSLRSASTICRDLLGRVAGCGTCRARKVEQRLHLHEVTRRLDAERGDGVTVLDILEDVVPQVDVVLDELAGNVLPVDAGIICTGLALVECLAANGPPGLGNPDRLALGSGNGLVVGVEEELAAGSDVVVHGGLEVGVRVHANEVNSLDDGVVGSVDVDGPGVDVTDGLALKSSAADSITGLLDVFDELLGLSTGAGLVLNTSGGDTVEVLAADGDTLNEVSEGSAVPSNGSLESSDLVVEVGLTGGGPHAEEETGLGVDSSLNGFNDVRLGAVLDHGVQTGAGPSIGARKLLGGVEFIFKVGAHLGLVVVEVGAVVEALDGSVGRGQEACSGEDGGGDAHGGGIRGEEDYIKSVEGSLEK